MVANQETALRDPDEDLDPANDTADDGRADDGRALTTLRGASVAVDPRRAAQVAVSLGMATLLILAVVFFVVGIHKNGQINSLEQHGVAVQARVTGCVGLLGGSGSNAAGYRCWGVFTIDGHPYTKDIPGTVLRPIGSSVPVIADSADPGLITTASELSSEHASAGVFVVPALLLVAFLVLAGLVAMRLRTAGHPRRRTR